MLAGQYARFALTAKGNTCSVAASMKKWLPRLYIPALLLVMTLGVFSILRFGYTPAPVGIMKPSFFDQPEQIGVVTFRRFFAPLQEKGRLAIGIPPQPQWYGRVIVGFLKVAAAENHPFDVVIQEVEMPDLDLSEVPGISVVKVRTNTDPPIDLVDLLKRLEAEKKRVLVYMPSVFSAHVLTRSPLHRIEKHLGTNLFSITVGPLALHPSQEYLVNPACVGVERDSMGTSDLGCVIMHAGRMHYRKKVPQDRWVAIMNSPKPEDYVLMISEPGQDKWDNQSPNYKLRMSPPNAPAAPGL
jgi:hypothetical protein